ncbi:MAG: hypothetical protein KDB26_12065, partial [Microthrixaceae bacterium]|nr:hypothetical protein [Microthrixaceae bacterium]
LAYLTLDGLVSSIGAAGDGFCNACLTGDYPTEIPQEIPVSLGGPNGSAGAVNTDGQLAIDGDVSSGDSTLGGKAHHG